MNDGHRQHDNKPVFLMLFEPGDADEAGADLSAHDNTAAGGKQHIRSLGPGTVSGQHAEPYQKHIKKYGGKHNEQPGGHGTGGGHPELLYHVGDSYARHPLAT